MRCNTCQFEAIEFEEFATGCPSCGEETSLRVFLD
jgi:predicted RNA-binding Zn-ribbon protein involved in translation (DUF1610 family)